MVSRALEANSDHSTILSWALASVGDCLVSRIEVDRDVYNTRSGNWELIEIKIGSASAGRRKQ